MPEPKGAGQTLEQESPVFKHLGTTPLLQLEEALMHAPGAEQLTFLDITGNVHWVSTHW
jgi:hypothetical protein